MIAGEGRPFRFARLAAVGMCVLGTACDKPGSDVPAPESPTGTARIEVVNAPSDVRCIRVNAAATRTITTSFSVDPGDSTVFTMRGLPTGLVAFTADAFAVNCNAMKDTTVATGVSDSATT